MHESFPGPPSDSPTANRSGFLRQLISQHPYTSTFLFFLYFILGWFLSRLIFEPVIQRMHLPGLQGSLLGEILLALVVVVPITVLRWWPETGFTRGVSRQGAVACLWPIALIVLPVMCGLPMIAGRASGSLLIEAAALSMLIGFTEEGLSRGLLLRSLLPGGIWTAVLLSSTLFAAMHIFNLTSGFPWSYVAAQLLMAFGLGVLLAAVRLRTSSIWPGIFLHAGHDFPGLLLIAIEPKVALSVPLQAALIVNGTFCLFFLLNAIYLLRPQQLHKLRVRYGLEPGPEAPSPENSSLPHSDYGD